MQNKLDQEPWLLTVLNSFVEGVVIVNKNGLVAHLNPAAERILEWKREEVFGQNINDIFHLTPGNDDLPPGSSVVEVFPNEAFFVTKSGKKIPVECSASFIKDSTQEVSGYVLLIRDVTQRQQIEEALKSSRRRYKEVVNAIDGIVWEAEAEKRRFLFVSKHAERLLGYPASHWISDGIYWTKLLHHEDRALVEKALSKIPENGKYELEYRLIHSNGETVWVRDTAHVISDSDQSLKLQGVMLDITTRKQFEQELRKAHDELEIRVRRRTAELEKVNVVLENQIEERRRAETKLREAEIKYRTLIENIPGIAYVAEFGPGAPWLYVGPQIETILGFTVEEWLADSKSWVKQIHPEDRTQVLTAEARSRMTQEPFVSEYRMFRKDGRLIWVHDSASVIPNEAGEPSLLQGVLLEITAEKQAEIELRYRAAFDELISTISTEFIHLTSSEVDAAIHRALQKIGEFTSVDRSYIFLFSENGERIDNTHEWCANGIEPQMDRYKNVPADMFQWSVDKLRNFEPVVIQNPENLPASARAERATLEAANVRSVVTVPLVYRESLIGFFGLASVRQKKDWTGSTIALLRMIGEVFINALIRQKGEEALRESEERYRALYEDNPAMYFTLDANMTVLSVNWFGAEQLGYAVEALVGHSILEILNEDDREFFLRVVRSLLKQEIQIGNAEIRLIRKDGTLLWVKQLLRVVMDGAGNPTIFVVCEDISEQKLIQAAMDQLQEQFRQAQKMEAIGLLAGGVAHDFNNILMAMSGYCELLQMKLKPESRESHDVQEIMKSVEQATTLTRQLLALGRRQVLQPVILDLNQVLADLEGMLRRLIREDILIILNLAKDLGQVKADPGQIEQVIVNLAVNARDAMPEGGKLTFETYNLSVVEGMEIIPGEYVVLSVRDNGSGMDEDILSRIFEPFFTTKELGKGSGLGLSMAYGVIKQSGGDIKVESKQGAGSSFKIYLPRVKQEAALQNRKRTKVTPIAATGSETILLVDDNDSVRSAVTAALKVLGYTVLEARDGEEALRISRQYEGTIHLIMTDIVMPEMGGLQLVEYLQNERPDAKFLFISGYADEAVKRQGKLGPGRAFLSKPASVQAIQGKIRELLASGT